jgi:small-conductance mechanosensitive channel
MVLLAGLMGLANYWHRDVHLERGIATIILIIIIYLIFRFVFEDRILYRIKDTEKRYYFSKAFYFIYLLASFFAIWMIWVEDIQSLLLGFGLVAAAVTISLQDVAKNFVGGLNIFFNNVYRVGDRIEIGSTKGDVIDIDIFYTTVMEINEWVSGDQPTGRLSIIPNGNVLHNTTNNYTRDFKFLWDEITIPVTYNSDWRAARSLIMDILHSEIGTENNEIAKTEISNMERKYFLSKGSTDAEVYIRLTDNWIELTARYITPVRRRRTIRSRVSQKILEEIEKSKDIKIASQTVDIVGFPEIGLMRVPEDK